MTRQEQLQKVQDELGPSLHPHFLIGDKVRIKATGHEGEIVGVGMHNIVCTYIVLLNGSSRVRGYVQHATALLIPGGELELLEECFDRPMIVAFLAQNLPETEIDRILGEWDKVPKVNRDGEEHIALGNSNNNQGPVYATKEMLYEAKISLLESRKESSEPTT